MFLVLFLSLNIAGLGALDASPKPDIARYALFPYRNGVVACSFLLGKSYVIQDIHRTPQTWHSCKVFDFPTGLYDSGQRPWLITFKGVLTLDKGKWGPDPRFSLPSANRKDSAEASLSTPLTRHFHSYPDGFFVERSDGLNSYLFSMTQNRVVSLPALAPDSPAYIGRKAVFINRQGQIVQYQVGDHQARVFQGALNTPEMCKSRTNRFSDESLVPWSCSEDILFLRKRASDGLYKFDLHGKRLSVIPKFEFPAINGDRIVSSNKETWAISAEKERLVLYLLRVSGIKTLRLDIPAKRVSKTNGVQRIIPFMHSCVVIRTNKDSNSTAILSFRFQNKEIKLIREMHLPFEIPDSLSVAWSANRLWIAKPDARHTLQLVTFSKADLFGTR